MSMKQMPMYVLMLWSILLMSCQKTSENFNNEIPEGTNFRVNYYTEDCVGEAVQTCLLVQQGSLIGSNNWEYFYSEIDGFTYEEGYVYNLNVKQTAIANPPMDGSSITYTLVEVLSKEER
ncbi:DUF4377 domain-containing protein [Aureispira sp. CCB-E]|uniref:DUF4377 domain-containing protein n=1 Tax=Aureispira sp. CCB-E TaxID=3051121 RepID=UPI002868ECFF|nr:DUF4377 domain-containing protein [Aureispira sp. CCB-E]WMX13087.1 DUF4377 domain-containing protein [Aureispira sp. CCB-E]